jgi:hypothetical protein
VPDFIQRFHPVLSLSTWHGAGAFQYGEIISAGTSCKDSEGCMTHNQEASEKWVHKLQSWETDRHRAAINFDHNRYILKFIDKNRPFCRIPHYRVPRYSPTHRPGC